VTVQGNETVFPYKGTLEIATWAT